MAKTLKSKSGVLFTAGAMALAIAGMASPSFAQSRDEGQRSERSSQPREQRSQQPRQQRAEQPRQQPQQRPSVQRPMAQPTQNNGWRNSGQQQARPPVVQQNNNRPNNNQGQNQVNRPSGGANDSYRVPKYRDPNNRPVNTAPDNSWPNNNRPNDRPGWQNDNHPNNNRPGSQNNNRPNNNRPGWQNNNRPNNDRPGWQNNNRPNNDRPGWQNNNRPNNDRPGWQNNRPNDRDWDRNSWRGDSRYNWHDYRSRNRSVYRIGRYSAPYSNYSYRRMSIGISLGSMFYSNNYWINDPWQYRLPEVYGSYRWVRYYDDVLLVDTYSGQVVDVIYDFFW